MKNLENAIVCCIAFLVLMSGHSCEHSAMTHLCVIYLFWFDAFNKEQVTFSESHY